MTLIKFSDKDRYNFAEGLLRQSAVSVNFQPDDNTVEFGEKRVARLYDRINSGTNVVLPFNHANTDYWLVSSRHRKNLLQIRSRLSRFLIPTYGHFHPSQAEPLQFDPTTSLFQEVGSRLFEKGYYRWKSPSAYRGLILERLMLWLRLEDERPQMQNEITPTYKMLHVAFEEALTRKDWAVAQQYLSEIKDHFLSDAENLSFLRLQLLASQESWEAIWNDSDFSLWSNLSMPRSVRSILLTAFHTQELERLEQTFALREAIEAFQRHRSKLGMLLTGPFEETLPAVVRVRAYHAVVGNELSRLRELQSLDIDKQSRKVLDLLEQIIESPSEVPTLSAFESVLNAIDRKDFALAEELTGEVRDMIERTLILIELAFHTKDIDIGQRAWYTYQALSFDEQENLHFHERFVEEYLSELLEKMLPTDADEVDVGSTVPLSIRPETTGELWVVAWQKLSNVEDLLRTLIERRYRSKYAGRWENHLTSDKVLLADWRKKRDKDQSEFSEYDRPESSILEFTYILDLVSMINREWQLFVDVFENKQVQGKNAKREMTRKMEAITRVRNPLAHSRDVPENELKRVDVYSSDLIRMIESHLESD